MEQLLTGLHAVMMLCTRCVWRWRSPAFGQHTRTNARRVGMHRNRAGGMWIHGSSGSLSQPGGPDHSNSHLLPPRLDPSRSDSGGDGMQG